MMEDFMKLLSKKAREQKSPREDGKMKAKAAMAKELSDVLGSDLTEDMKGGVKKVVVASNTEEGLKKGLRKAEETLDPEESEGSEEMESDEEMSQHGDMEESEPEHMRMRHRRGMGHEMEDSESEDGSESEMQDKISELEAELERLKSKRK